MMSDTGQNRVVPCRTTANVISERPSEESSKEFGVFQQKAKQAFVLCYTHKYHLHLFVRHHAASCKAPRHNNFFFCFSQVSSTRLIDAKTSIDFVCNPVARKHLFALDLNTPVASTPFIMSDWCRQAHTCDLGMGWGWSTSICPDEVVQQFVGQHYITAVKIYGSKPKHTFCWC